MLLNWRKTSCLFNFWVCFWAKLSWTPEVNKPNPCAVYGTLSISGCAFVHAVNVTLFHFFARRFSKETKGCSFRGGWGGRLWKCVWLCLFAVCWIKASRGCGWCNKFVLLFYCPVIKRFVVLCADATAAKTKMFFNLSSDIHTGSRWIRSWYKQCGCARVSRWNIMCYCLNKGQTGLCSLSNQSREEVFRSGSECRRCPCTHRPTLFHFFWLGVVVVIVIIHWSPSFDFVSLHIPPVDVKQQY